VLNKYVKTFGGKTVIVSDNGENAEFYLYNPNTETVQAEATFIKNNRPISGLIAVGPGETYKARLDNEKRTIGATKRTIWEG